MTLFDSFAELEVMEQFVHIVLCKSLVCCVCLLEILVFCTFLCPIGLQDVLLKESVRVQHYSISNILLQGRAHIMIYIYIVHNMKFSKSEI